MAFLTAEELASLPAHKWEYVTHRLGSRYSPITSEKAQAILDDNLRRYLAHDLGKRNRPWELVDLTSALDPDQAWFGWEVETGWANRLDYELVVNKLWFGFNHCTIDGEGWGSFMTELTFQPQNAEALSDGTSDLLRFYNWMDERKLKMLLPQTDPNAPDKKDYEDRWACNNEYELIGTHVNISTPSQRFHNNQHAVMTLLRDALYRSAKGRTFNPEDWDGSKAELLRVFGRGIIYSNIFVAQAAWIECKAFKSTHDSEVLANYVAAAKRIAEVIEATAASGCRQLVDPEGNVLHTFFEMMAYFGQDLPSAQSAVKEAA